MEDFDPYRKWLGIPPADQPPDHYRLLGIGRFEDDPDTIANAADRQMTHVRTFQTGPRSALSQKLLNEIAAARLCLLNATKKAEYDNQLRDKEGGQIQPPAGAPSSLQPAPRPMTAMPLAALPVTVAPFAAAGPQSPAGAAPRTPAVQSSWPQNVAPPVAGSAPINIAPAARRSPPTIVLPDSTPEPSEAYQTLLIAAGLAVIVLAIFVVYKMRSGGSGKGTDEQAVSANLPRPGQQLPSPPVDEPTADSKWLKLTRQLNDLDSWKAASGQWSEKDGRLYGQGDAQLEFQEELPGAFLLSFEMTVLDGMRPRIFIGYWNLHFGNEGYQRTLYVHDGIQLPVVGAPRHYSTGVPLRIDCRFTEHEIEVLVDGKLAARCGHKRSDLTKLTLSAGDWWSKGQVLFGPFTIGPAPPEPMAPSATSSGSIDLLALVDAARDQVDGKWKREGAALVSPVQPSARLQLPYSPGEDYEVTVEVERLSGADSFVFGLVIGGRQVAMTLDGYGGAISGLADLDKHDGAANKSTRRGKRLPPGQPHTIVCTVHAGSVRATCDGQEALVWSGDAARLSNSVFWDVPDKQRLYLGAWESKFKYTRIEVRSLPPAAANRRSGRRE